MNQNKNIHKLAFVDPNGKNLAEIKKMLNKSIDLILNKIATVPIIAVPKIGSTPIPSKK